MRSRTPRRKQDPTTSLINIVFLILIFFMVAGSLAKPPDPRVRFVQTEGLECCSPPDALYVASDGALSFNGVALASADVFASNQGDDIANVRIAPDQELPANDLLALVAQLQAAGAKSIIIITETVAS